MDVDVIKISVQMIDNDQFMIKFKEALKWQIIFHKSQITKPN